MSSIIEREDGTMVVTVRLTLKPGRDDALMDAIRNAAKRQMAAIITAATRSGLRAAVAEADEEELDLSMGIDL